jgi:hypothetical protein
MAAEPHISDVTRGNVVICGPCGGINMKDSAYCRECGRRLSDVEIPANGARDDLAMETREFPLISPAPEPQKSLLEKLDLMERELEAKKQEALPEPERKTEADKLDEYDGILKNIAFTLDTLISDLLKAEAQEYAFSDSRCVDGKSFAKKDVDAEYDPLKKKRRNFQEVIVLIVMITLIVAIFLVGMTFGLWGSYFFGI